MSYVVNKNGFCRLGAQRAPAPQSSQAGGTERHRMISMQKMHSVGKTGPTGKDCSPPWEGMEISADVTFEPSS